MNDKTISNICVLILSCMIINLLLQGIAGNCTSSELDGFSVTSDRFRAMNLEEIDLDYVGKIAEEWEMTPYSLLSILLIYDLPFCEDNSPSQKQIIKKSNYLIRVYPDMYQDVKKAVSAIFSGIYTKNVYFPVPYSITNDYWVNYVDSWGFERTYGGNRHHEGTDILADYNESGVYPIVSVTSGVVENKGWLEMGGWRIGIRTDDGGYYYYAHLAQYADIEVGDRISAGELIGFMGDSGYGVSEGTSGLFDVHLHFGIYIDHNGNEISINPYWIIKHLEKSVLGYSY